MRRLKLFQTGLISLLMLLTVTPVMAQDGDDPVPPGEPGFVDGVWTAIFATSGPLEIGTANARTRIAGGGLIIVENGQLSGDYTANGDDLVIAEGGSAQGTMVSEGSWAGTSTEPGMVDGNTSIEGVITVDGVSTEVSYSFPSTGTVSTIPIISATCSTVVGDMTAVTNSAFASVGVSSNLYGTFVATRLLDSMPGDEPPDYYEEAWNLHMEGLMFYADTVENGSVDSTQLNDLLARAEDFYDQMARQAACGIGDAEAWLGLMAGMVQNLLDLALEHPDLFENMDLLRLVSAGVRMGLFGSGAESGEAMSELEARLIVDLLDRASRTEDYDELIPLSLIASILGYPEVASDVTAIALIALESGGE